MRILLCFCVCLLAASAPGFAAPASEDAAAAQALKEICAKTPCRKTARTLSLRMPDKKILRSKARAYPYLDPDGTLILLPGDTITLGIPKDGNGPAHLLKVVEPGSTRDFGKASESEAPLSFQFKQLEGEPDMVLMVTSAAQAVLKYDAVMLVPGPQGIIQQAQTPTCPVRPQQGSGPVFPATQDWPHPIATLVITNIHALAADAPQGCN